MADQQTVEKYAHITRIGILATAGIWLLWDGGVFSTLGGGATESTQIGNWMYKEPSIFFAISFLIGHFLLMGPQRTAKQWKVTGVLGLLGVVMGAFVTWWRG